MGPIDGWSGARYRIPSEQTIYAAASDITERKEANETIERYSRDLAAAREAGRGRLPPFAPVSELEVRDLLQVVQSALQASRQHRKPSR